MSAGLKPRAYKFLPIMTNPMALVCDGCGQAATAEHIARRLQRLEWTTRYRPVHIHTLLLGAYSPLRDEEFLYASDREFGGEAAQILDAVGISTAGKTREAVHAEFQRAGFFLTHVLDDILEMVLGCPVLLDRGKPFLLESRGGENGVARLRQALAAACAG